MREFVAGIVAEYNPFHTGHEWMVRRLREEGASAVVCVLSGPFVQRAEPAFLPAHARAEAAVAGGVDLVLRLPLPYAVASAEAFAAGGVGLLAALGCVDVLAFGAEEADTGRLQNVARLLETEEFSNALRVTLNKGLSFAAARAKAADVLLPGTAALLRSPNNILAVEYCKALEGKAGKELRALAESKAIPFFSLPSPKALPRMGARHDGIPEKGIASASWLRELAGEKGIKELKGWVPEACLPLYKKMAEQGQEIDRNRYELAMLSRLRGLKEADFSVHGGEGLGGRLEAAAQKAVTLEELFADAKTKRFAHSRVRRAAVAAALGLPAGLPAAPPFAHVLAANATGLALLRKAKQTALLPVSTSLAKLVRAGPVHAMVGEAEAEAENFYALCQKEPRGGGLAFTQPAHIAVE